MPGIIPVIIPGIIPVIIAAGTMPGGHTGAAGFSAAFACSFLGCCGAGCFFSCAGFCGFGIGMGVGHTHTGAAPLHPGGAAYWQTGGCWYAHVGCDAYTQTVAAAAGAQPQTGGHVHSATAAGGAAHVHVAVGTTGARATVQRHAAVVPQRHFLPASLSHSLRTVARAR